MPSIPRNPYELEKRLAYEFRDKSLLKAALTHRSYRFENDPGMRDNQRLEFLGDAVIGLILAEWVYLHYRERSEGMLTILRSNVVSSAGLAKIAAEIALGDYLLLGRGEESGGGRSRESNLADALEALMAALYLDGGLENAKAVFNRIFANSLRELNESHWAGNPRGHLQTLARKIYDTEPVYTVLEESGPSHARVFHMRVTVGDSLRAEGTGSGKQAAAVAAAEAALAKMSAAQAPEGS